MQHIFVNDLLLVTGYKPIENSRFAQRYLLDKSIYVACSGPELSNFVGKDMTKEPTYSPQSAQGSKPLPVDRYDARGLICPMPVLKMRKRLMELSHGDVFLLLADDPAALDRDQIRIAGTGTDEKNAGRVGAG